MGEDYKKIIKDKSVLQGNEKLFKKRYWVPYETMNESLEILKNPIFDKAFKKILSLHKKKSEIVFFSLCTSTRPYHLSRKWKVFKKELNPNNNEIDLVVVSSGGVIPEEFWESYPFLNYDGHTTPPGFEKLYREKMEKRLKSFLRKFRYKYVIANFRPSLRNHKIAKDVLSELKKKKVIEDYCIIPDEDLYEDLRKRGFPSGKMFPDLDEKVLNALKSKIQEYNNLLEKEKKEE